MHGFATDNFGVQRTNVIFDKIMEFAADDIAAGRITVAEVDKMLDLPLKNTNSDTTTAQIANDRKWSDIQRDVATLREQQDTKGLMRRIWLPKSLDDDDSGAAARYDFVREWLQKPVRGSRDRRLMCLLRFLDEHQMMASSAGFRHLCIKGCENLLSLWETLPRMMKTFTSDWQSSWHASIAWNYFSLFLAGGQWTLFDKFHLLVEVDKRCDLAIEGFRKSSQSTSLANIERLQAQVCILFLRRIIIYKTLAAQTERSTLDNKALEMSIEVFGDLEPCVEKIPEVRQQGLKLLTETDEIYSNTEREASWEEGLGGIEKRKELSRMQMNHTTTRYAIRLWTDGVEHFDDETRTAVWSLTQKYKARLLSLAVGMFRVRSSAVRLV